MRIVLEAGQSLFIPRFWWHHVTALEPAVGLNFWWSSGMRALRSIPWDILFVLRGRYR
jgi:ribosomal protein L16 Arg81 hydroxylase